jgi:GNAT superfamily N-acetyltransferase
VVSGGEPAIGGIERWGPHRAADLTALASDALGHERLTVDELLACCWEDPGVVLGTAGDPVGAVAAVTRPGGDAAVGFVRFIAVHPGARRLGLARHLLDRAESWLAEQGCAEVHLGGSAPFYLWPGVDVAATAALCLFEAAGYEPTGAELDLSMATTFRRPPSEGVEVRRVLGEGDAAAVRALVERQWPWWWPETARGIEGAGCLGAFVVEEQAPAGVMAVGFVCHSVNRAGWLGPMGTDPAHRRAGVGHALLGAACRDLMAAGFRDVEIAWIGPIGFYASAGASVSRVFRTARKRLVRPDRPAS